MTQYYYDCPINAMYMADKFGIFFDIEGRKTNYVALFAHEIISEDKMNGRVDKYYIHPDSVSLFKPQMGDLIEISETYLGDITESTVCSCYYVANVKSKEMILNIVMIDGTINTNDPINRHLDMHNFNRDTSKKMKIIQRGCLPFIMPY